MNEIKILKYLKLMASYSASDLHLHVNQSPVFRIHGELESLTSEQINKNDINDFINKVISESDKKDLLNKGELDFSFELSSVARFRGNVYYERGNLALVFRLIPLYIPSLKELCLPTQIADFTKLASGLVIVTGATGSGKSTTMASMLNLINKQYAKHIVTLEDPIEYLHSNKKSIFSQREIGRDTISFTTALRSSLREDPDVILIGEMRDLETTDIAIRAAETGHLVFATMHTPGATESIERILGSFPPHQRSVISSQLSFCLKGVIFQKLLPKQNGGRVAAVEIMTATPAVCNLIRENKTHQLKSILQTSRQQGMISMNGALQDLFNNKLINKQVYESNLIN